MAKQVSDYILERLNEWGITRIFGFPGDGINGVMGALDRAGDKMDFVQVRHEEMAAFMACAHSKFTGEVGVCMATSGPGAVHLLNGLYDAKMDHQSVVAIVGQQARRALGGSYQQEIDLISLFKDVAGEYVHMVTEPAQARQVIDRAVRIAKAERTVTCVILPNDLQEMDAVEAPPREHGSVFTGVGHAVSAPVPPKSELERAAQILNEGKKVAILIGAGAIGAGEQVKRIAEKLGAGVAKALLGKAALPDDIPYVTGSIGLLGTEPSSDMMNDCDTLLMIGSSFPYSEFLPKEGQARGVQIDIDGKMLSLRYPMELNLIGDSKATLEALIPLIEYKKDRSWRETIEENSKDYWKVLEARAMNAANPINPQRVFWELSPKLPDNCILAADSGSSANWFARDLKIREGMMASLSGNLATMCPGVPYVIAAKFAYPDRIPIALVGDGAMQMLGINGLITIAKYWKRWKDPRLVIMVLKNCDLNQVTWEQRIMSGNPEYTGSQEVPDFPYAQYAEMLGLKGVKVDDPDKVADAWDQVLNADRPAILEAVTDPNVPTLPPHISFDQAFQFAKTLVKGDPKEGGIIKQSLKEVADTFLPH
ncbi:thiamine pyrophosphate-requiring protein [Spirosoma spitsbergense]|uniref:thiamine pyrophosphate-requiring protein n=1 Tax=Spirosoma spitsbergense TaxID=431554 RepID=UPI0003606D42|nr:thiamine pyrophosphate-requiring protein [Spirosoma spitsbergense]